MDDTMQLLEEIHDLRTEVASLRVALEQESHRRSCLLAGSRLIGYEATFLDKEGIFVDEAGEFLTLTFETIRGLNYEITTQSDLGNEFLRAGRLYGVHGNLSPEEQALVHSVLSQSTKK